MTDDTKERLERLYCEIADVALREPALVALATLEELVNVACGTHPHLKDFMRAKLYQSIRDRLAKAGAL